MSATTEPTDDPVAVVAEAIHWYGANPQAEASPADVIVAALREAGLLTGGSTPNPPEAADRNACYDQACPFDHPNGGPHPHPCNGCPGAEYCDNPDCPRYTPMEAS